MEALDFIVNVLKEHEKDLDKLINELATVTEQMGDTGELNGKVEKIEEKITNLQKEVTTLISCVTAAPAPKELQSATALANQPAVENQAAASAGASSGGPQVILKCRQWEDFVALAFRPQTLSFSYKEEDKVFQADALKGNQIVSYSGALPKFSSILKLYLSKQLDVSEKNVLEGGLATT